MEKMAFKTFTWPQNPRIYREVFLREPVHKKNYLGQYVFAGMGPLKRTITGSGVFFGEGAYTDFRSLAALFDETTAGTLVHPVFGTRTVFFTGLELQQEPKSDYVAYSFTFREADADGSIPK